ncbi:MAG: T9SS type A sorting domain-containing protein, partial [Chitinophagaceae bacterium]|nr:T9SS type A sorting domain-containing protein [Chitinophagaceae bacterium]
TGYYKVNLSTLNATAIIKSENEAVYNASDLASSNLAYRDAKNTPVTNVVRNNGIAIYPNPVVNKTFAIQFDKMPAGNYTIEISDINGKKVIAKTLNINGVQNEKINMPKSSATGLYFIKVVNSNGNAVYTDKFVVE